jgi:hypothetical protein
MRTLVHVVRALVVTGAVAAVAVGCASNAAKQAERPDAGDGKDGEDLVKTGTDTGTNTGTAAQGNSCSGAAVATTATTGQGLALFQGGAFKIDGKQAMVFKDRSKVPLSLCQALLSTGKKAAVFQFAGADCIECRDESVQLRQRLAASPVAADVIHILVFTDILAEYPDSAFETFRQAYAPTSPVFYDESVLWKAFSEDPALPNRATILAMNLNQDAVIYNRPGEQGNIVPAVEDLARKMTGTQP